MSERTLVVAGMVVLAALSRLIPHPPNFAPIGAMALFAAASLRSKSLGLLVPLLAMVISDVGLEIITRLGLSGTWMTGGRGFHDGMWFVYASILLSALIGFALRQRRTVPAVGLSVLASSILFYLLSNLGVWLQWDMYPMTPAGLLECYVKALPFFHWTLLGDAFYATVLFGGFAWAEQHWPALAEPDEIEPAVTTNAES